MQPLTQLAFAPTALARFWDRIDGGAARIAQLGRWKSLGLSFLAGALASLALPPAFLFPVLWIAFPVLAIQINAAANWRRRLLLGWGFGFGLYLMSLYWIAHALIVASDDFLWMVPFAAIGLPAFLALFPGLAAVLAGLAPSGPARVFALAAAWLALEVARGHVLTGFPWNLMGHAWAGIDSLLQAASWFGVYGMSGLVLLSAVLPALAIDHDGERHAWTPGYRLRATCLILALLVPFTAGALGASRLASAPGPGIADTPGVGLRIVQASIPQREKWGREFRGRNFLKHLSLSVGERPDWITTVIWPETAAAFFLEEDERARALIADMLPPGGHLLTGAPRRLDNPFRLFNSVLAVDDRGTIVGHYDKAHLVPFGEYNPFRGLLAIAKIAEGSIDYSAGPGPATMTLDGLPPFSPLVCYEAIFPGAVVDPDGPRPAWLLNLTNDAWYGETAGPHQHLTMARLRAVEEGLPLIRSTNTGITVAFDAFGRELGRLPLNAEGVLDLRLPRPLNEGTGPTVFSSAGMAGAGIIMAMFVAMTLHLARLTRRPDDQNA